MKIQTKEKSKPIRKKRKYPFSRIKEEMDSDYFKIIHESKREFFKDLLDTTKSVDQVLYELFYGKSKTELIDEKEFHFYLIDEYLEKHIVKDIHEIHYDEIHHDDEVNWEEFTPESESFLYKNRIAEFRKKLGDKRYRKKLANDQPTYFTLHEKLILAHVLMSFNPENPLETRLSHSIDTFDNFISQSNKDARNKLLSLLFEGSGENIRKWWIPNDEKLFSGQAVKRLIEKLDLLDEENSSGESLVAKKSYNKIKSLLERRSKKETR